MPLAIEVADLKAFGWPIFALFEVGSEDDSEFVVGELSECVVGMMWFARTSILSSEPVGFVCPSLSGLMAMLSCRMFEVLMDENFATHMPELILSPKLNDAFSQGSNQDENPRFPQLGKERFPKVQFMGVIKVNKRFTGSLFTGQKKGKSPTFSMSLSLARFEPRPPVMGTEDLSSLPLPEPISEPWPLRLLLVVFGAGFGAV